MRYSMKDKIKTLYRLDEQECQTLNMIYKKPQLYMNSVAAVALCRNGSIMVIHNPMNYNFSGWDSVTKVSCGKNHLVGLRSDGTVLAAGDNSAGQCDVSAWRDVADIAAYDDMTVGLSATGEYFVKGRAISPESSTTADISALKNMISELREELAQERKKISTQNEVLNKLRQELEQKNMTISSACEQQNQYYETPKETTVKATEYGKPFDLSVMLFDIKRIYDNKFSVDRYTLYYEQVKKFTGQPDKYTGKRLDGIYEIERFLGAGRMGMVYKGHDNIEDKTVAIKILKEEFLGNEEFIKRFRNVSKAISALSHSNIVKVYDVSFGDRIQYFVTEYIEGIALGEYLEQMKVVSEQEAIYITLQIVRALEYAHQHGIVHGALNTKNIMLQKDGTVKITAFELYHTAKPSERGRYDDMMQYISPEIVMERAVDGKADIYSVGVMLYEMLTGKLPFNADSMVSLSIMKLQEMSVSPKEYNNHISIYMENIIMRAIAKDPMKRYTAKEMLQVLLKLTGTLQEDSVNESEYHGQSGVASKNTNDVKKKKSGRFFGRLF